MKIPLVDNSGFNAKFVYKPTRRRFLHVAGASLAATLVDSILPNSAKAASTTSVVPPYALRFTSSDGKDPGHKMIVIYLQGGFSNVDAFDPKASSPFRVINTEVNDIKFTEILQPLAKHTSNFVVINNLHSNETLHDEGAAFLLTTKKDVAGDSAVHQNPFIDFAELLNRESRGEIGYVVLHQNTIDTHGFNRDWEKPWGALKHDEPMTVYSPYDTNTGSFTNPFSGGARIPISRFRERAELLDAFDSQGHVLVGDSVERHNRSYRQAMGLLDGDLSNSFNLGKEAIQTREKYGDTKIGKQLLLARRMLERGARVVVANDGNYDHHWGIKKNMELMAKPFSKALDALIEDIKIRFNEKVFIAIVTEFGRTPTFNRGGLQAVNGQMVLQEPGRDHWPYAFGMVVICNDKNEIDGGRTIGQTNNSGEIVGNAFPSSLVADSLLNLLKIGRFEKRGEAVTNMRFPFIDIVNGRVAR